MRRNIGKVVVLAVVIGAADCPTTEAQQQDRPAAPPARPSAGQPAPRAAAAPAPAPNPPPDPAKMKALLRKWEARSAQLRTLDATITRVDKSPAWGDETYEGRAILKAPDLAYLNFKRVEVDEKKQKKLIPFEQIRCTGTEVWQYRFEETKIYIFPLDKKGPQGHVLEEGPLPFLFNMKADEAEKRYFMECTREDARSFIIRVTPLLPIDQENFSKAFLQLDRSYLLPTRIFLISPNGKDTKDYVLSNIVANQADEKEIAKFFVGQKLDKPWQIIRNPGGDTRPQNAGAPRGPARAAQPALRANPPADRR